MLHTVIVGMKIGHDIDFDPRVDRAAEGGPVADRVCAWRRGRDRGRPNVGPEHAVHARCHAVIEGETRDRKHRAYNWRHARLNV
jgi:hypothetical protein